MYCTTPILSIGDVHDVPEDLMRVCVCACMHMYLCGSLHVYCMYSISVNILSMSTFKVLCIALLTECPWTMEMFSRIKIDRMSGRVENRLGRIHWL